MVGLTYSFTDVRVCILVHIRIRVTPITEEAPAQIVLGGRFLFPRALAYYGHDLDLCSQGQVMRALFIGMGFP